MKKLGFASEKYHILISDLLKLKDSPQKFSALDTENYSVILFIGQKKIGQPDLLGHGRDILLQALASGQTHYPVHIAFEQRAPHLSFFALLKPIRKKYQDGSMNSYEIKLTDIIDNHLERNLKTEDTAYNYSDRNKWGVPKDQRSSRFNKIDESFKQNGYDKNHPMVIMLCRGLGVKDKLHQGHHRMFFCRKYNIQYVQVEFLAANSFTGHMNTFFLWLNKTLKYKQVN